MSGREQARRCSRRAPASAAPPLPAAGDAQCGAKLRTMSNQIRLIHPIYLDVPMLVSFAAAVEGGVSFGAEVTRERTSALTTEAGGSAKFGLSALFGRFFDASV
jgi:hypothetical protein